MPKYKRSDLDKIEQTVQMIATEYERNSGEFFGFQNYMDQSFKQTNLDYKEDLHKIGYLANMPDYKAMIKVADENGVDKVVKNIDKNGYKPATQFDKDNSVFDISEIKKKKSDLEKDGEEICDQKSLLQLSRYAYAKNKVAERKGFWHHFFKGQGIRYLIRRSQENEMLKNMKEELMNVYYLKEGVIDSVADLFKKDKFERDNVGEIGFDGKVKTKQELEQEEPENKISLGKRIENSLEKDELQNGKDIKSPAVDLSKEQSLNISDPSLKVPGSDGRN